MDITLNSQPLVSVYIPSKNRQKLLALAIESITKQSYQNIEILVVDDGSTDDTFEYLQSLTQHMPNLRIFKNKKSLGACASRNLAIEHAKGEFVTGLDDDDLFLPERISSLVSAYDDRYAFICSSAIWDYGNRTRIIDRLETEVTLDKQLSYNEATSQVLVKKERIINIGGFDESFVACQDYDLWTRLIIEYGSAYRIGEPSYVVNDTGSSQRMISNPNSVKGYEQYFEKHGHLMSGTNILNQEFMRLRRCNEVMSLGQLIRHIGQGYFYSKLRYYLSSNFSFIRMLHRKYYK